MSAPTKRKLKVLDQEEHGDSSPAKYQRLFEASDNEDKTSDVALDAVTILRGQLDTERARYQALLQKHEGEINQRQARNNILVDTIERLQKEASEAKLELAAANEQIENDEKRIAEAER